MGLFKFQLGIQTYMQIMCTNNLLKTQEIFCPDNIKITGNLIRDYWVDQKGI